MNGVKVKIEETLFRRSYSTPLKKYLNPDGSATSRVFSLKAKDNGKLSVDVKSMTAPQITIQDPAKFILFEIDERKVEEIGLFAVHDPIADNEAHAFIQMDDDDDISPGLLARYSRQVAI